MRIYATPLFTCFEKGDKTLHTWLACKRIKCLYIVETCNSGLTMFTRLSALRIWLCCFFGSLEPWERREVNSPSKLGNKAVKRSLLFILLPPMRSQTLPPLSLKLYFGRNVSCLDFWEIKLASHNESHVSIHFIDIFPRMPFLRAKSLKYPFPYLLACNPSTALVFRTLWSLGSHPCPSLTICKGFGGLQSNHRQSSAPPA